MLNLMLANNRFVYKRPIHEYISCVWRDRFYRPGDFELRMVADKDFYDAVGHDDRIVDFDGGEPMVIESKATRFDWDEGPIMEFKGRSLRSVLDRRIERRPGLIPQGTRLNNMLKDIYQRNVYPGTSNGQQLPNIPYSSEPVPDWMAAITVDETEVHGKEILEIVNDICDQYHVGSAMFSPDYSRYPSPFKLVKGTDRSISQTARQPIIFSQELDNVKSIESTIDFSAEKNMAIFYLDDQSGENKSWSYNPEIYYVYNSGFDRREVFAKYTLGRPPEGMTWVTIPVEYTGKKAIRDHRRVDKAEAEVIETETTRYGQDFFVGDIVTVRDEFGSVKSMVIEEYIRSVDKSGESAYPTLGPLEGS